MDKTRSRISLASKKILGNCLVFLEGRRLCQLGHVREMREALGRLSAAQRREEHGSVPEVERPLLGHMRGSRVSSLWHLVAFGNN